MSKVFSLAYTYMSHMYDIDYKVLNNLELRRNQKKSTGFEYARTVPLQMIKMWPFPHFYSIIVLVTTINLKT